MQPTSSHKSLFFLTGNWILMLVLASIAFTGIGYGTGDIPVPARQIMIALSCSLTGFLLLPVVYSDKHACRHLLLWSVLVGAGCFLLMAPYFSGPDQLQAGLRLAAGTIILVYLAGSLFALLRAVKFEVPGASLLVALLAVGCSTAPLWLGPLAQSHISVDAIIAISPVSYLAGLADYDYLRSNWFYQHTPFGGLRYHYPSVLPATIAYLSLAAILMSTRWLLAARRTPQPAASPETSA